MPDKPYTRVSIETDSRGRMSINVEDDDGHGHGYRLAGPKFDGTPAKTVIRRKLTESDVTEIRLYLAHWDTIHASKEASTDA